MDGHGTSAREFFDDEEYTFLRKVASREGDGAREDDTDGLAAELAALVLEGDVAAFERALERDGAPTRALLARGDFLRLVLLGLSLGVACGDPACANYLGALYYMGEGVPQDYLRAKELYELADSKGHVQGMVNLGYVYEYGRVGEPDFRRAYMQYAKAAAIAGHFEALYKLGDMYGRGRLGERDPRTALALYDRSLDAAQGLAAQAQPAFRIARLVSDPESEGYGIPYDPMGALGLYQLAERGLRVDIAHGQTYYRKRLAEAIEGQELMRRALDDPGFQL